MLNNNSENVYPKKIQKKSFLSIFKSLNFENNIKIELKTKESYKILDIISIVLLILSEYFFKILYLFIMASTK